MSQKRLIWQQDRGLNFAARWGNEKEMSKEDHVIFLCFSKYKQETR